MSRRRDDLAPLRSVSAAYKRAQIPVEFRSNQERDHEPRKSVKAPACRAAQAGGAGRDGGAQAPVGNGGGGGSSGYDPYAYLTATSAWYANPSQYQLMMQQAAAQQAYQQMANAAAQNVYGYGLAQQAAVGQMWIAALPPSEPAKPLPVEIKAGELVAWRCWRIVGGGKLISMTQPTVWEEGVAQEADVEGGLGIHAWKTEAQARDYAKTYYTEPVAIGTIELWGHVIEHDEGYRAQYGQIKEVVERMVAYPRHRAAYGTLTFTPDNDKPRDPLSPLAWGFGAGGGLIISGAGLASSHPGLGPLMVAIGCGVIAASIVIHAAFRP